MSEEERDCGCPGGTGACYHEVSMIFIDLAARAGNEGVSPEFFFAIAESVSARCIQFLCVACATGNFPIRSDPDIWIHGPPGVRSACSASRLYEQRYKADVGDHGETSLDEIEEEARRRA